uniref:Uncharacterized protein n=1 Tax=Picea glauca TaxID=3330 RepID=A0A101M277_PICGL|nr:hypothetical protein ABT39_MTgene2782 [Picea glauca]
MGGLYMSKGMLSRSNRECCLLARVTDFERVRLVLIRRGKSQEFLYLSSLGTQLYRVSTQAF